MSTDLLIMENLHAIVKYKNDESTIKQLKNVNRILADELEDAEYPRKEVLRAQYDANQVIIKRLQTGKY